MAKTLNVIKRSPKKQPKGRFSKKEGASVPELSYRDDKEQDDYYGSKAAGQSDSSEFSRGGPIEGKGHKSHLGRPGRASGGRATSGSMTEKPRRSIGPDETDHASEYGALSRTENTPPAGRANRASGGRTKGKTVVNVIVAGGRGQQQPMPAPMPMPPPAGRPQCRSKGLRWRRERRQGCRPELVAGCRWARCRPMRRPIAVRAPLVRRWPPFRARAADGSRKNTGPRPAKGDSKKPRARSATIRSFDD